MQHLGAIDVILIDGRHNRPLLCRRLFVLGATSIKNNPLSMSVKSACGSCQMIRDSIIGWIIAYRPVLVGYMLQITTLATFATVPEVLVIYWKVCVQLSYRKQPIPICSHKATRHTGLGHVEWSHYQLYAFLGIVFALPMCARGARPRRAHKRSIVFNVIRSKRRGQPVLCRNNHSGWIGVYAKLALSSAGRPGVDRYLVTIARTPTVI